MRLPERNCRCEAYAFPHRMGGGGCQFNRFGEPRRSSDPPRIPGTCADVEEKIHDDRMRAEDMRIAARSGS